jgi:hypothetical protein
VTINKGQNEKSSVSKTARDAVNPISNIVLISMFFISKLSSFFKNCTRIISLAFEGGQ